MPLKLKIFFVVCISVTNYAFCQDIHFTQATQAPLFLNPALTGNFDGDLRFSGNFRNQWSAIPVPYNSGSFGADFNFLNDMYIHGNCGAGLLGFIDEAGDSKFRTLGISGSFSFNKFIGRKYKAVLSFGVNVGYVYKGINTNTLRWDEQFNGDFFDPSIKATDPQLLSRNNLQNLDIGLGINYMAPLSKITYLIIGASFQHINSASQTFYATKNDIILQKKPVAYAGLQFKIGKNNYLKPELFYQWQDDKQELVPALLYKHVVRDKPTERLALTGGVYVRAADAIAPTFRIEYNQWTIGVSYDVNASSLTKISSYQGGLEVSVIYIQKFRKKKYPYNFCPFLWL